MLNDSIIKIREHAEFAEEAAEWFHSKWNISKEAYTESIRKCLENMSSVPQWYIDVCDGKIIAGLGVIENDFHNRKDLTPNVCAVYVEKDFRKLGIAGKMLSFACKDMKTLGVDTLYLLTNHTGFYEQYGWEYLCNVQGYGEMQQSRMYIHQSERGVC